MSLNSLGCVQTRRLLHLFNLPGISGALRLPQAALVPLQICFLAILWEFLIPLLYTAVHFLSFLSASSLLAVLLWRAVVSWVGRIHRWCIRHLCCVTNCPQMKQLQATHVQHLIQSLHSQDSKGDLNGGSGVGCSKQLGRAAGGWGTDVGGVFHTFLSLHLSILHRGDCSCSGFVLTRELGALLAPSVWKL